jgi:hypothetical protein
MTQHEDYGFDDENRVPSQTKSLDKPDLEDKVVAS